MMVERAAAGEAPSSPQPPEAGARRARLYGVSSAAENRNRQTMPSNWCGTGFLKWGAGPPQPTLEKWAAFPLPRGGGMPPAAARFNYRPRGLGREGARGVF